jgi:hypothetical protein
MRNILLVLVLIASPFFFAADSPRVYVSFEGASPATITPGKSSDVDLHFKVKEGFHVNSNQPKSELLIPTTLKLELPTDLAAGSIIYPPGKDLSFPFDPSEKLNVYSEDFTVKAKLSAAKTASTGNFTVHGQLRYQACSDNACFPPKSIPVQFDVQVVNQPKRARGTTPQSPHIR